MKLETQQEKIDRMLAVEDSVTDRERRMYMEYMNGRTLRKRTASLRPPDEKDRDVREGCMLAGVFQRARGIKVMRLGIPCHFTPDNPHAAACGVEWPALGSPDVARVDCFRCRRTWAFKIAIKQTCKGGAV